MLERIDWSEIIKNQIAQGVSVIDFGMILWLIRGIKEKGGWKTYALMARVWQTRDGAYGISQRLGRSARICETSNKSSLQGLCAAEE